MCMNPYPQMLQEAAEGASTHELWARKSNTAPAVKATAAAFSVQESEEKSKSIIQEFEKLTKTLLEMVNTLINQNVGKGVVRGGMRSQVPHQPSTISDSIVLGNGYRYKVLTTGFGRKVNIYFKGNEEVCGHCLQVGHRFRDCGARSQNKPASKCSRCDNVGHPPEICELLPGKPSVHFTDTVKQGEEVNSNYLKTVGVIHMSCQIKNVIFMMPAVVADNLPYCMLWGVDALEMLGADIRF